MLRLSLAGLCTLCLMSSPVLADSDGTDIARVDVGFLTCTLSESADTQASAEAAPGGQSRDMVCSYKLVRGGGEEVYLGTVQGVGDAQRLFSTKVVMWAVRTTGKVDLSPGLLEQTYTAEPTGPKPAQPPPLIGDTNKSVILQSLAETKIGASQDSAPQISAVILAVTLKLKSAPA